MSEQTETAIAVQTIKLDTTELQTLEKSKSDQIKSIFDPMAKMVATFEGQCSEVFKKYQEQLEAGAVTKELCDEARKVRIAIGKVRIETEKKRKAEKEEYVRAGKAIDGVANIVKWAVEDKEKKLEEIEDHFEKLEEEKKRQLQETRKKQILQYDPEAGNLDFSTMEEVVYNAFLENKKNAFEKRQEEARIAEELRIKKEEEDRIAKEAEEQRQKQIEAELKAQREENARLAEEARKKEEELAAQRKLEEDARLKKEAEEKAKRDRIQAELEAKQKELDAIKEAERKAEEERVAKEKAEAEEKEKARLKQIEEDKAKAKLPEKERINAWVESFAIPSLPGKQSEVSEQIQILFDKFKKQALKLNQDS